MKKFYFLILCLLVFSSSPKQLFSQKSGISKKDFKDAEYLLLIEEFDEALVFYLKILRTNPQNANINYRIGLCYLNIPGQKIKSIPFLQSASAHISEKYVESTINEVNAPIQTLFLLGTAYQVINEFQNAIKAFSDYKGYLKADDINEINFIENQINSCIIAEKFMKEPLEIEYKIIGNVFPLNRPSFYPVMSENGEVIVYKTSLKYNSPLMMVRKHNNRWSRGVTILPEVISEGNCFPASLSADGTNLFLVIETGFDSDLYMSIFDNGVWTPIKKLGKTINTKYWETYASISPDGKTLYFSSNRKGGIGALDIYKSALDKKGQWGPAVNLGKDINTPYNEDNAVISGDNKTLFFSSQGHSTMGGYDIFKSVQQGSDSWSVPVNLGYPINTTDDNRYYYPIEGGEKGLYSVILDPKEKQPSIKEIRHASATSAQMKNLTGKESILNPTLVQPGEGLAEQAKSLAVTVDSEPESMTEYTILLAITPNRFPSNHFKSLEEITSENLIEQPLNGQYAYTLGRFYFKDMAEDYIKHSAFKPYPGVKVVRRIDEIIIPETAEKNAGQVYGIQVMALKNPTDLAGLSGTGLLKAHECTDGFFRYIYGEYSSVQNALTDLQMIKDKGYPGAFVINTNRIKSISLPKTTVSASVNYSGKYTIQLKALRTNIGLNTFKNLQNVRLIESGDKIFRYIYGEFNTLNEANKELVRIRKLGNIDAFVRETETIQGYL